MRLVRFPYQTDSEPTVTLVYKVVMTSPKWFDFNYFEVLSCTIFRSDVVPRIETGFWRNLQWANSHSRVQTFNDVIQKNRFQSISFDSMPMLLM